MSHQKHGVTSGKASPGMRSPQGMGQPGTESPGDGEKPVQVEILDTSPCVPQPPCGLVVTQPRVFTCCSQQPQCPCPRPPCGPRLSHIFPSLLRVLIIPGVSTTHQVPITSQVPIVPWGPHCSWGPHHPRGVHYPSRSSLLLGGPVTFRVPIVPGISLTPRSPSPLVSCCPCVPFTLGAPNTTGVPISPGASTVLCALITCRHRSPAG